MKRTVRTFCAALLLAAALVSCDFGPQGLFSLLEEEIPLNDGSDCFKDRTVSFVLTFQGYYYAGIGASLFRRPVTGGSWESVTVSAAPTAPAGEIYAISSAVTDGSTLYLSYAPVADTILSYDGTTWSPYVSGLSSGEPVQKLLIAPDDTNHRLFAATSRTEGSSSPYTTYYSLYYDNGGTFTEAINDAAVGCPSSIAYDTANSYYYIAAGTTIYTSTNADPGGLATYGHVPSGVSTDTPVLDVYYDSDNSVVIAACTGYLYRLTTTGSSPSGVFGNTLRQLSCAVVVPSNDGGHATIVGVKPWGSNSNTGYYEYDASLNASASFSSVAPDTSYELITSNSNYVTTLDDYGIDGFYYDSTNGVLFARAVHGGLWSNSWNGSVWSKWNRE